MSDIIIVALIAALPGVISAGVGIANSKQLNTIHVSINSRMDQLLNEAKALARVEGQHEERKRQNE